MQQVVARKPVDLPAPTVLEEGLPCPWPWQKCEQVAGELLARGGRWLGAPSAEMQDSIRRMTPDLARASSELGFGLAKWSLAMEVSAVTAAGIDPYSLEASRYYGRGQHVQLCRRPLPRPRPLAQAGGKQTVWWSSLAALLAQLSDLPPSVGPVAGHSEPDPQEEDPAHVAKGAGQG